MKAALQRLWFDPKGRAKLAPLCASPFFWILLAAKLLAGSLFASDYLSNLFIPFLESFVAHPFENPYATFLSSGQTDAFPYPALMLDMMAAPRLMLDVLVGASPSPFLLLFLYRLPLLLADFLIAAILTRWSQNKIGPVLWLYWASPALFYITYLHGQLDVIPIALLFLSLHFLFKEKFSFASLFLGLGLATKTHLVIVVPFFLLYVWRQKESLKPLIPFVLLMGLAFLVPNLPYLDSPAFYEMVFHNAQQKKIALATLAFSSDAQYYLLLGVYLFLLFGALQLTVQNRDLFLMFLGVSFGALLFFIAPMPGWYFWVLPFFAYFFIRAGGQQRLLFWGLQGAYLLYFIVKEHADYREILQVVAPDFAQGPVLFDMLKTKTRSATDIVNLAYTILQTALAINCLWIYQRGVGGYQKQKLTSQSFLLGIAGDSGSGKTTLANSLSLLFSRRNVSIVCGDDKHKWQRGHEKWKEMTHLDPRANALHQELKDITALRHRRSVRRRHYDHETGTFVEDVPIPSRPIVVFEGLHSFYLKPAREMMDLKIFIKPDDDLLLHHKILRDQTKRGHSKEKILESIEQRKKDAEKYIKAQEQHADIVIAFRLAHPLKTPGDPKEKPSCWIQILAPNSFYFDPLIADLGSVLGHDLRHTYETEDRQSIEIHKLVSKDVLNILAETHLPGLQDLGLYAPIWDEGYNGILQLFIAWCIFADSRREIAS